MMKDMTTAAGGGHADGADGFSVWDRDPWLFDAAGRVIEAAARKRDRNDKEGTGMIEIRWNGKLADGIKNVKVITSVSERLKEKGEPVETKITVVEFKDGRREKAVCDHRDTFSLETGISLCIAKYLAGSQRELYDAVRRGMEIYEKQERKAGKEKDNG